MVIFAYGRYVEPFDPGPFRFTGAGKLRINCAKHLSIKIWISVYCNPQIKRPSCESLLEAGEQGESALKGYIVLVEYRTPNKKDPLVRDLLRLGSRDSNPEFCVQSATCCRYTTPQY